MEGARRMDEALATTELAGVGGLPSAGPAASNPFMAANTANDINMVEATPSPDDGGVADDTIAALKALLAQVWATVFGFLYSFLLTPYPRAFPT